MAGSERDIERWEENEIREALQAASGFSLPAKEFLPQLEAQTLWRIFTAQKILQDKYIPQRNYMINKKAAINRKDSGAILNGLLARLNRIKDAIKDKLLTLNPQNEDVVYALIGDIRNASNYYYLEFGTDQILTRIQEKWAPEIIKHLKALNFNAPSAPQSPV